MDIRNLYPYTVASENTGSQFSEDAAYKRCPMQVCRAAQVISCLHGLTTKGPHSERRAQWSPDQKLSGRDQSALWQQQGPGQSSRGWDSRCLQSIRSEQSILSQTPLPPLARSVLKARGGELYFLHRRRTDLADCQLRLQLSGMWHAYQVTQLETNLATLVSCKWFSQEDMHLYLPTGRKALLLAPEAKVVCIWSWIFTTNLGRRKKLPKTALLPHTPCEQHIQTQTSILLSCLRFMEAH